MDQLSFFPSIYECNMRKIEVYRRLDKGDFICQGNFNYLMESLDMLMTIETMYVTTELEIALREFIKADWEIEQKYIDYANQSSTIYGKLRQG